MDSKHIERDYSAHRKSVIRPYDEYVKLEIFSFDHPYTKTYIREDNTLKKGTNATKTNWKSWSCFKSSDKHNPMVFDIKYTTDAPSEYRIDLVYEQNDYIHKTNNKKDKVNTSKDLLGSITVDGNESDVRFDGENNVIKRKTIFRNFKKGSHNISVKVPHNCYFYGIIIRKILTFIGDNYYGDALGSEEGNMVLTKCTVTNSDMTKANELSAEVFYDPSFTCDISDSGFYIDYHDEMNFYVKADDGSIEQIFGGYVSTILPDSDLKKLTIIGADRLVDGQNKYILDQMRLGGGATALKDSGYTKHMSKDFSSYPKALKYLCDIHEITLKSNISKAYTVDGESFHDGFIITYGKKKKIKKIKVTNGKSTPYNNYILLRNNASSEKKQIFNLYKASDNAKKPPEITNYPYLHITYGLGKVKKEYKTKTTQKVDTADTTAGSQKFTKCGVSADGKYLMAIGLPSAGRDSQKGWTKTVFERKCPHCGSTNLVWDIGYGSWGYAPCRGASEGGGVEGHIFCKGCDSDYSCQGYEHISGGKSLKKASSTVASSKAEADKLRAGQMMAVPSSAVSVSSDDVFKAISNIAFKYHYRLGAGSSSYSSLKRTGYGDCWAFSELIFEELKKYKVSCKIMEYNSGYASNHRSVIYRDANNKWAEFPYRQYGWGTKFNNMLNNYPIGASLHGRVVEAYEGNNIGTVKASTSTSKTETKTVTTTKGYDKDKPFQAFLRMTYSLKQDFKAKKYTVDIKFTQDGASTNWINGKLPLYWVNNTIKQTTLKIGTDTYDYHDGLIYYLRKIHNDDEAKIYLQSLQFVVPTRTAKKENEDVDWYKHDENTKDGSSCKINLYQISFDDNSSVEPSDLQSCGKSVNTMLKEIVNDAGYYVNMTYGKHRKDDIINFRVLNQSSEQYTASEGDNNNILSWGNISYSPVGSLMNMSMQVFKDTNGQYHYVDSRSPNSILKYGEQCTLQTSNEAMSVKQAYFNATQSDKYRSSEQYTYTITVPNMPKLRLFDLVRIEANANKLSDVKEVKSLKVEFDYSKIPRVRTEIGCDELSPTETLKKTIHGFKEKDKTSTAFSSSATPIENEIYYEWDK